MDPRYGPRWREGGIRFDYGRNPRMLSIPGFCNGGVLPSNNLGICKRAPFYVLKYAESRLCRQWPLG
jgi:hypothetical protein